LVIADEQSRAPFNKPSPIPKGIDWESLMRLDGDELETHYRHFRVTGQAEEHARRRLPQGAEQNPGPGEAHLMLN
jgi:hypothetical protein